MEPEDFDALTASVALTVGVVVVAAGGIANRLATTLLYRVGLITCSACKKELDEIAWLRFAEILAS